MGEHNIVVLGAGVAGLNVAHSLLRHVIPAVTATSPSDSYKVILVNPSSHFYWVFGAPRALISEKVWPLDKSFGPIAEHFSSYPKETFEFVQGQGVELDAAAHKLIIRPTAKGAASETRTIEYRSLVLSVGSSADNPLWGVRESHEVTRAALQDMHKRLPAAKSIVIAGGGAAGTETAGEIAFEFGKTKQVTILSGSTQLLSTIRPDLGQQAEKYLEQMHAKVRHNVRVTSTSQTASGATNLVLSDGSTLTTDLYIDATGLKPNTGFLPRGLLATNGKIETDAQTLRVPAAGSGAGVYSVGSAASYSHGGVLDVMDAIPPLIRTIEYDLSGGKVGAGKEGDYHRNEKDTMVVPVGRSKGVGVAFGWKVPSVFVWLLKGRDYMSSKLEDNLNGAQYLKKV
ncbi:MAG: hypothetical protein M4579_004606 [Chaenotheca gracillima]|nr:MAG: hypothetical protein M4579_004606 [Chaenotheca gracillima]